MINIGLSLILLLIVSEGCGYWLFDLLNIKNDEGFYVAPAGVALIFCLLEVLYLPILLTNNSFGAIKVCTFAVLIFGIICVIQNYQRIIKNIFKLKSLYVLVGVLLMAYLMKINGLSALDDTLVVSLINVNNNVMSNLNGLQGYFGFASMVYWFNSFDVKAMIYVLSLFLMMISSMLVLNYVDSFRIGNPWFKFTLIFFSIFYTSFYAWKLVIGFSGDLYRLMFVGMLMHVIYLWFKFGIDNIKFLIPLTIGAGLFVNHGFLVIGVELLYCLAVFMFREKKIKSLYDLSTFFIPIVVYWCFRLRGIYNGVGTIVLLLFVVFLCFRRNKHVYRQMIRMEDFLLQYNRRIFFLIIPIIFFVVSLGLRIFSQSHGVPYSAYLNYFKIHTVSGFLFPRGNILDIVMDVWRWLGVIIFVFKAYLSEDRLVKYIMMSMIIFFVNPFCMGLLTNVTSIASYAYGFEIIFNSFMDILIIVTIYQMFEWSIVGQWILELCLVFVTLFGHISSFMKMPTGLYNELVKGNYIVEVKK